MLTIHKYTFEEARVNELPLTEDAKILAIQNQNAVITLWVLLDPKAPRVTRTFIIVGTGQPLRDEEVKQYIGTVQIRPFVWHIFEIPTVN